MMQQIYMSVWIKNGSESYISTVISARFRFLLYIRLESEQFIYEQEGW